MNYYERIQKSIDYIEENLENKIQLEQAAKEAFMSMSNFYRMFLAITGHSAKEYIRLRRITWASKDILESKLRIIDIAMKYEYNSADSFSRAFKNVTGFLPSVFKTQKENFIFERLNIMEKYFEEQDKELLERYPDIKVLKELEPMRVAYCCYVGKDPEQHAFELLIKWIVQNKLDLKEPQYRIFGYNNPSPLTPDQEEYGYEVCITIPDDIKKETDNIKIKYLEGGLYAVTSVTRSDNIGEEIMKAWQRFSNWIKGSKYSYGGHQWLEEHLGFSEEGNHIGGVDLYMPIKEEQMNLTKRTFQTVEPMLTATYTAYGKNAIEVARGYFFNWIKKNSLSNNIHQHKIFAYYNFQNMGTKDFFYKIHITVADDFESDDDNIQLEKFPGGYYAVMNSKYSYNEWAWNDFMNWINSSNEYVIGDYWFFEEYMLVEPEIIGDTELKLYMPIKTKN